MRINGSAENVQVYELVGLRGENTADDRLVPHAL